MKKAALFVEGKVVLGDSHLEAFKKLTDREKETKFISGFFNTDTEEFDSDTQEDHFYDKEILLVRHGHTQRSDNLDPSISDQGLHAVHEIANQLREIDLKDYVGICSPLLRCLQTANILQKILKIQFSVCPKVIEIPNFLQENEKVFVKNHHLDYPDFKWSSTDNYTFEYETYYNFLERSHQVLQNMPHKVIVVTHFGFICNFARFALCKKRAEELATKGLPPASATHIKQKEVECLGRTYG